MKTRLEGMTYKEAKLYIEEISKTGSILGLESIKNLMQELGNVQERLRVIHIGGTNGKGSTGAFIEAVCMEAGFQVGRYTSPAVFEPFEVWRINRENISLEDYLFCLEEVKRACERMLSKGMLQPTVFEVETALAFVYFYKKNCDYVLLEVGMGGETDATNLITKPICSVLTSISMDHMQFLGNSLEEIARVKTGIIKNSCPVVTGSMQKTEVMEIIKEEARGKNAELFVAEQGKISEAEVSLQGMTFVQEEIGKVEIGLAGVYQLENANLAITVCKEVLHFSGEVIRQGLKRASWQGRFEVLSKEPVIILDGAHNEDAAEKLYQTLQKHFTNKRIAYIIGVLADKEHEKMLKCLLSLAKSVYTVTPPNKRALDGRLLAQEVESLGTKAFYCESMKQAADLALQEAEGGEIDVILAFGSLSYLGALKEILLSK